MPAEKSKNEKTKSAGKPKLLRKITPKLFAKTKPPGPYDGGGTIVGIARRYEEVTTAYGTSACFRGDFAVKGEGELAHVEGRSNKLYLPRHVEGLLVEAIDAAVAVNVTERGEVLPVSVRFGFRLYQSPIPAEELTSPNQSPYEWDVESIIDPNPTGGDADPVAALLAEATAS